MIGRVLARLRRRTPAAALLISRADAARDSSRYNEAATLYTEALRLAPALAHLRVQLGHMLKESGRYEEAECAYLAALPQLSKDADLALQLGHLYKTIGRLEEAERRYTRALELGPEGEDAAHALADVAQLRGRTLPLGMDDAAHVRLAPDLAPGGLKRAPLRDGLHLRRLGREEHGRWGVRRTMRGVEAIHGSYLTPTALDALDILVDGRPFHRHVFGEGHLPAHEPEQSMRRKYVFNLWVNCTPLPPGLHMIELRFTAREERVHVWRDHVVVAAPVPEADYPGSDALVVLTPGDPRSPEEQIRSRPSMVRPARRTLFPDGVRNILVLRTDQLGDMIAAIPALQRLRALAPGARIVGLLTAANADFGRTLDLFDEIIVVDFPDDPIERRRLMPLDAQEALRRQLAPYDFDVAIDLALSNVSRELLRLTGARFLHGFGGGGHWPWLQGQLRFDTPDRWAGLDTAPHSTKMVALVEAFGAILDRTVPLIRRDDLSPALLEPLGLVPGTRYVLLHAGARIAFSRWPHHAALALRMIERTDLAVVMIPAQIGEPALLPAELAQEARFHLLDRPLTFDQFDALVSHATVVVGNDSGPKHLAALRGVPVVTLFTARIGWSDWGQEDVGTIISRRVPCAGCLIFHDAEDCGQEFSCLRDIGVDEVLTAVLSGIGT